VVVGTVLSHHTKMLGAVGSFNGAQLRIAVWQNPWIKQGLCLVMGLYV